MKWLMDVEYWNEVLSHVQFHFWENMAGEPYQKFVNCTKIVNQFDAIQISYIYICLFSRNQAYYKYLLRNSQRIQTLVLVYLLNIGNRCTNLNPFSLNKRDIFIPFLLDLSKNGAPANSIWNTGAIGAKFTGSLTLTQINCDGLLIGYNFKVL